MTPELVLDILRQSVMTVIVMVVTLVMPGLLIGLIVAMFQAATQINEMTLSFIPRLLVTFIALSFTGAWLLKTIINYTSDLFNEIPNLIG